MAPAAMAGVQSLQNPGWVLPHPRTCRILRLGGAAQAAQQPGKNPGGLRSITYGNTFVAIILLLHHFASRLTYILLYNMVVFVELLGDSCSVSDPAIIVVRLAASII
jgi:hypothetical protein